MLEECKLKEFSYVMGVVKCSLKHLYLTKGTFCHNAIHKNDTQH